jgi:hypothetical protein
MSLFGYRTRRLRVVWEIAGSGRPTRGQPFLEFLTLVPGPDILFREGTILNS